MQTLENWALHKAKDGNDAGCLPCTGRNVGMVNEARKGSGKRIQSRRDRGWQPHLESARMGATMTHGSVC